MRTTACIGVLLVGLVAAPAVAQVCPTFTDYTTAEGPAWPDRHLWLTVFNPTLAPVRLWGIVVPDGRPRRLVPLFAWQTETGLDRVLEPLERRAVEVTNLVAGNVAVHVRFAGDGIANLTVWTTDYTQGSPIQLHRVCRDQ